MTRLITLTAVAAALVATTSLTAVQPTAEAFTKDHPTRAPYASEWQGPKGASKDGRRQPGTYEPEEYEAAMPDFTDPFVDGPQLECTACLSVSDIIARRFSKLKREFRVNMENVKPFHVDAALDELCTRENQFVGLLHPNITNDYGARVDKQYRSDRMEKEDEILAEAKKKWEEKQSAKKKAPKSPLNNQQGSASASDTKKKKTKKGSSGQKKTEEELKNEAEEREWRKYGLDEYAIARRKRLRMPFTIWPEFADDREIRKKLNGGIPQDVTVLRNTQIHAEWQRYCGEAMTRMEDFGLLKVFRGSKSFNLCPMCKRDNPLAQGRDHNPGGVSSNPEEAAAVSDAELKKQEKERKKRLIDEKLKSRRVDAGDDDEDEKFIRGGDDEYEL